MNARRFTRVSLIIVPVSLRLGCLPPPQVAEDLLTAEPTLLPLVKPTATRQPTAVPSPTTTPRPTITPRPTQTPTATPLPFPMLEPDEMQAFIAEMLATNGGCELPCWWGITPGETRWDDMVQFFEERSVRVEESGWLDLRYQTGWHGDRPVYDSMMEVTFQREGDLVQGVIVRNNSHYALSPDDFTTFWEDAQQQFLSYGKSISSWSWDADEWGTGHKTGLLGRHESYPFDYVVEHILYEQEGIVSLIGAQGHAPGWPADEWSLSPRFVQDWERYALDQVLARFGKPFQVLLHYWSDHESLFSVGVLYEDRGILVEYMGLTQGEKEEDEYHFDPVVICPTRSQLTDINVWLKPPETWPSLTDVFVDFGGGYLGLLPYRNTPSLGDATGMSLDTFHTTYLDPNADVCLEAQWDLGDFYP